MTRTRSTTLGYVLGLVLVALAVVLVLVVLGRCALFVVETAGAAIAL